MSVPPRPETAPAEPSEPQPVASTTTALASSPPSASTLPSHELARFERAGLALAQLPPEALPPTRLDVAAAVTDVRAAHGLPAPSTDEDRQAVQVLVGSLLTSGMTLGELREATRRMAADPVLSDQLWRYRRPLLASDFVRAIRPEGAAEGDKTRAGRLYTRSEALALWHQRGGGAEMPFPESLFDVVPTAEGEPCLYRLKIT